MQVQTREEVERMLELASRTDEAVLDIIDWADLAQFPIEEAVRLCGDASFGMNLRNFDRFKVVEAREVIKMALSPIFDCEIRTNGVSFVGPFGLIEIEERSLSMVRYYVVLLVARLWAFKHAPGELPVAPTMQTLLDYLKEVPDQEDPDYYEIRSLARIAGLSDYPKAKLLGKTIGLSAHQILEEIAPSVVKCELQADGTMKIWYPDTPDEIYILADSPWIQVFEALNQWLAKHPD